MRFIRETYRFRIFAVAIVLIVFVSAVLIPINNHFFNSVVLESTHQSAFSLLRYLSAQLKERNLNVDLLKNINLIFKREDFLGMVLLDGSLNPIVVSGDKDLRYREILTFNKIEDEEKIKSDDSVYYYIKRVDLKNDEESRERGYLILAIRTDNLYHNIAHINKIRIVSIISAFILLVIFAYFISIWLTRPFYRLSESIEGILRGERDLKENEDTGLSDLNAIYDRIRHLLKSLNDMRDSLLFSEESLKAFLSRSRDIILILNRNFEIEYASPIFAEITGIEIRNVNRKLSIRDFMNDDEFEKIRAELNRFSGVEVSRDIEICIDGRDDKKVCLLASWIRREDSESKGEGIILFAKDITAHKQLEDLLKRQTEELETILFSLSHDLKSPVFTLKGMSHLFRQKYYSNLDEQGKHFIDRINENIVRMERLISNMLDISRSKRQVFKSEKVNLNELIDLLISDCREQLVECNAKVNSAKDLPIIRGDKDKLYIVFKNLLENSLKYRSPSRKCEISILKNQRDDGVEILFEDNGMGIESKFIERLFKPFSRAVAQTDGMPSGHGIGLSIVKGILDAHNCKISVESSYGEWTRFRIYVPSSIIVNP